MKRLHIRHLYFIFLAGYAISLCYLIVVTRTISAADATTGWAYLWTSPMIALLTLSLLAALYSPLGVVYAALLLLCLRSRFFPLPYVLSLLCAAGLIYIMHHLLPFSLIDTQNQYFQGQRMTDTLGFITLTLSGWAAMVIYLVFQPSPALQRLEDEMGDYLAHRAEGAQPSLRGEEVS